MRAVIMREFGGANVLELDDVTDPTPGPGEALIRVGAVEVSTTRDIAARTGHHPFSRQITLPHVLGGDFAGVVEATGAGVDEAWVGKRVAAYNSEGCGTCVACRSGNQALCPDLVMLGVHRWGSYAELATVAVVNLHEIPDDVSLPLAAAMGATGPIALTQLMTGHVEAGTWLLIPGVTGALGTTLAALGAEFGARVIGLTRRPSAIPAELPLEARLDSADERLTDTLLDLTDANGVNVAIDNIAAPGVFSRYFPALAIGAKIVVSGAIGGAEMPVLAVPAAPFYVRSLSLLGVRTTALHDVGLFWEMVRNGFRLPDGLVHTIPLADAARAHRHMAGGTGVAHTVLTTST